MAEALDATFFDPYLAELQRNQQLKLQRGTADMQLQSQRLTEDMNLMRPYMERKFGQQMDRAAAGAAGRGISGSSGAMRNTLAPIGEDQAFARGQFEQRGARQQDDLSRNIARLAEDTTMTGAEGVRKGAGNASSRTVQNLPF